MLFLRCCCRNLINGFTRSHEMKTIAFKQRYCSLQAHFYSTCPSAKESISSSKSDFLIKDNSNTSVCLQKPSQRSKMTVKRILIANKNNYQVTKIKTGPISYEVNDPDVFGNLSNRYPVWYPDMHDKPIVDNDLSDDSTIVRNISKHFRDPHMYLNKMKSLVSSRKLKEALELFIDMKRNFVLPLHAHYTFMIGACAKFGYLPGSFQLFRQMTDRGFQPTLATLTSILNACAESSCKIYGLRKVLFLIDKIETKNWDVNIITKNTMIKTLGKLGDLARAFQIFNDMDERDQITFNNMLIACIENKEAGFTFAVEVYRTMMKMGFVPDINFYNLFLRAVRDCGVGSEPISRLLLENWSNYPKRPYGFKIKEADTKEEILQLSNDEAEKIERYVETDIELKIGYETDDSLNPLSATSSTFLEKRTNKFISKKIGSGLPSILHSRPNCLTEIKDLSKIKTFRDRLDLCGGAENFLNDMKKSNVKPNIKTFTLLLPSMLTIEEEERLIYLMEIYDVKPDTGFCNMLMKQRNYRFQYAAAQEVLAYMNKWSLSPDLITFGVLAVSCTSHRKAVAFMNDMKKLGYTPNIEMIGALISNACKIVDFLFIGDTLKWLEESELYPDEKSLKTIENCLVNARKNIIYLEYGKSVSGIYKREGFQKSYKEFCKFYEDWLKDTKLEKNEHVWDQFRTNLFEKPIRALSNVQVLE